MKVEVLLATMFFENERRDLLDFMNIQTDIIVGNQCNKNEKEVFSYKDHQVVVLSTSERGVGKNRNVGLFYSDADVVLFADNDVCYYDGYKEKIEEYYQKHPQADVVIFNFKVKRNDGPLRDINIQNKKAGLKDIGKFGTYAVTARRESILKHRISFSLLFGGGAQYSCGEDSLFLSDCRRKGLNIYLSDDTLGEVIHKESTWFDGINKKYIFDKGALFKAMYPKLYKLFILRHAIKHRNIYTSCASIKNVIQIMFEGAKDYR